VCTHRTVLAHDRAVNQALILNLTKKNHNIIFTAIT
jgi:hypothetical protein